MVARETELYQPVKAFLSGLGYDSRGEVHGCDLAARRGVELLIVEMKRVFSLELVLQGVERQGVSETVYLAIEEPRGRARRRLRRILRLCRLLGLGLLTVRFSRRSWRCDPEGCGTGGRARVDVLLDPAPYKPRLNTRRRGLLLEEFQKRSADYNTGGSVRRKLVTAYREEALRLAWQLKQHGPCAVKQLRELAHSPKAQSILFNNFYGWFERVTRGVYRLTGAGERGLETYAAVVRPSPAHALPAPRVAS
ncbi:MAG: DUF2161 family putative PD-(D/E)XK-type phosphodiesterase [Planctomycetota bacterium]|nr:DUF2161 family putative PD-(D/E)XK-type phosphodiesterase [Planctomycetota bacterium]